MLQEVEVEQWAEVEGAAPLQQALIEKRTMQWILAALGSASTVRALGKVVATKQPYFRLRNNSAESSAMGVDG